MKNIKPSTLPTNPTQISAPLSSPQETRTQNHESQISNLKSQILNKKRPWLAFFGPGLMIAVGYMDPGNWATDIAGGSKTGYSMLFIILVSNLFAILLQYLALKLGIATGRDLAQACHDRYSRSVSFSLWILCEIAIIACDLAEVLGSAIALNLLFGIKLSWGVVITSLDVLIILYFQKKGFRALTAFIGSLIVVITCCFIFEVIVSHPNIGAIGRGLLPSAEIFTNPNLLYLAVGIMGATIMPHNLYLHSHIVQTAAIIPTQEGKKTAIHYSAIDSTLSLTAAFFVNAFILILAAAAFHDHGLTEITDIAEAHKLLNPLVGTTLSGILFAVALLAAGQNATITGTLAGQIVMEGFINLKLKPWARRLITRSMAIIPALTVALLYGEKGMDKLLIFTQVVLSLQLAFAVVPLVTMTSDKKLMGVFVNPKKLTIAAWAVTALIIGLNLFLSVQIFLT